MANKHIGETEIQVEDVVYTLRFGSFAISQLEEELNISIMKIAEELEDPNNRRMKTLIACLWAGLLEHHESITMRAAALILDDYGFIATGTKVAEALNLAFPEVEGVADESDVNPPANRRQRRATKAKK